MSAEVTPGGVPTELLSEDEITDLLHKYTKFLGDGDYSVVEFDCPQDSYNFTRAVEAEVLRRASARTVDATAEPTELVLKFGAGLIEVGQGHHGNDRVPAILFGRNGAGTVGVETEGDCVMLPGECIAALTFDNPESLDVVMGKLAELRTRIWPDYPSVTP